MGSVSFLYSEQSLGLSWSSQISTARMFALSMSKGLSDLSGTVCNHIIVRK